MQNTNQNTITFRSWYETLPANVQVDRRNEICAKCEWSISTFYKKLNGHTPFKMLEKDAINNITGMELEYNMTIISEFGLTK